MPDSPAPAKKDDDAFAALAGGLIAVAVIIVLLPIATASAAVYLSLRSFLSRVHFGLLGAFGVVGLSLDAGSYTDQYLDWIATLFTGDAPRWRLPVFPLVFAALVGASVAGLLADTRIARWIPTIIRKKPLDPFAAESLLPTEEEKQRSRSVAVPGGVLTPNVADRSVRNTVDPENRLVPLGHDRNGRVVGVHEKELGMHMTILGGTGSGKTESIKQLVGSLLDLGWSGMVLDLKNDIKPETGLRDWCKTYAQHHAIPFQQMAMDDPDGEFYFNALQGLSVDEAREAILSLMKFDDQFWQALSRKTVGQMLRLLVDAHQVDPVKFPYPTAKDLGILLEKGAQMKAATKEMRATILQQLPGSSPDDYSVIANPDDKTAQNASTFGMRLTGVYDTETGRTMLQPAESRRAMDVTAPGLTYVGLDSLGKPELTMLIAASMLQRMCAYAAFLTRNPPTHGVKQRFVVVDEANFVIASESGGNIFLNLLSRARSAGLSIVVCTQGPEDFGEAWGPLVNNINCGLIMSQGSEAGATMAADFIGFTEQEVASQQIKDGELMASGTVRRETVHFVPPHMLRKMGIGEAVLRVTKPAEKVGWLSVKQRDPRGRAS